MTQKIYLILIIIFLIQSCTLKNINLFELNNILEEHFNIINLRKFKISNSLITITDKNNIIYNKGYGTTDYSGNTKLPDINTSIYPILDITKSFTISTMLIIVSYYKIY